MSMTRLTFGISSCCAIIIVAALLFLSSDTQSNERVRDLDRALPSPRKQHQPGVPLAAALSTAQQFAEETPATLPPVMNSAQLTQQVADLSEAVARLEQTARNLEDRISRSIRPLSTSDETGAGLARRKAELDAQAKSSQAATADLQRFAARFGMALDERILTDRTFPTPLDKQPGFEELRLAATTGLRVLQAVEKRYAADLLDRASIR
ncbi:MAG: hypothetical protein ABIZ56_12310 [Chthoniobacteraceae bacterium]